MEGTQVQGAGSDIRVTKAIQFGSARVGYNGGKGPMSDRPLLLDLYEPAAPARGPRPALIMAFGGALHRNNRANDVVPEGDVKNTAIADYCARFAAKGYVCASIDYRLTQEDGDPGTTLVTGQANALSPRVDEVRRMLGLGPATPEMMRQAIECSIDDMAMAFRFVAGNARQFQIDATRIIVGGFSSGARTSLGAAFGEHICPAGVVSLSGLVAANVVEDFAARGEPRFPVLVVHGENDLGHIVEKTPAMLKTFAAREIPHTNCMVPGGTHFYPAEAATRLDNGGTPTVEQAISAFVVETVGG